MSKISLFLILALSTNFCTSAQVAAVSQLSSSNYISFASQQADNLKDSLILNPAQTIKVKTIYTDYFLAIININNTALSVDQRKIEIKKLNDNRDWKLKEVLANNQFEKYQLLLEHVRQKILNGRH